ncbi:glycosyltransferase family 2 protein [Clostridium perfringens]|uniref:glycosyltransferase family 2 protein n=1 Tax=Clostridium perfringens TaxID=1502 RepID=UPI0028E0F78A|nr:glycosyltransferase [Clostridium perfringens]MDT9331591.1 glycosyltransferase [Clostridium perfringens]
MIKVSFLVLHYKNIQETENCIKSILNISKESKYNLDIVVVDNGSNNGTGETLKEIYRENSAVKVIISKENLGFSKGNNLGYEYIRKNIKPNYVVVTNNDVIFFQKDFVEKIDQVYKRTNFFVLGPDIYVQQNKEHQSPIAINKITIDDIERELSMYKYYLTKPHLYAKRRNLQILKNRIYSNSKVFSKLYDSILRKTNIDRLKKYEDVVVQGACIIVSKRYLELEEKMFSPEPFLYCEELFLYFKCLKKKYKIIYEPSIKIFHEDSASIKSISNNSFEKARFTLKHHVSAREMLLSYLKNEA